MGHIQPFRFGVLAETARSGEALRATAREAEDAGWSTLLIRDHFTEAPFGHQLAPFAALAWAAAITTTLRVGTLVLDHDYRHPVVVAKEAATLDVLSDGRFELGLGAGWAGQNMNERGSHSIRRASAWPDFRRRSRCSEGLFADAPLTFSGGIITSPHSTGSPKARPAARTLPILVGAGGKRMLGIAARRSGHRRDPDGDSIVDGVLTDIDPAARLPDVIGQKVEWIRAAAGARIDRLELSVVCSLLIDERRHDAAERLRRVRGWRNLSADEVLTMPTVFLGGIDEIVEQMYERRERYGISYFVVSDQSLRAAAPIVSRLSGR